jgi:hypothetical protein
LQDSGYDLENFLPTYLTENTPKENNGIIISSHSFQTEQPLLGIHTSFGILAITSPILWLFWNQAEEENILGSVRLGVNHK